MATSFSLVSLQAALPSYGPSSSQVRALKASSKVSVSCSLPGISYSGLQKANPLQLTLGKRLPRQSSVVSLSNRDMSSHGILSSLKVMNHLSMKHFINQIKLQIVSVDVFMQRVLKNLSHRWSAMEAVGLPCDMVERLPA